MDSECVTVCVNLCFSEVLQDWSNVATRSYQTVFPGGHQLPDVVHRVEDDMVEEFIPVHGHRAVLIHPGVHTNNRYSKYWLHGVLSWRLLMTSCVFCHQTLSAKRHTKIVSVAGAVFIVQFYVTHVWQSRTQTIHLFLCNCRLDGLLLVRHMSQVIWSKSRASRVISSLTVQVQVKSHVGLSQYKLFTPRLTRPEEFTYLYHLGIYRRIEENNSDTESNPSLT